MKTLRVAFVLLLLYSLTGCAWLSDFYKKPAGGGPSTAETVQGVVRSLPYGELISGVIGLGGLLFGGDQVRRHKKTKTELKTLQEKHDALLAAGKKDDNNDGVDDALQKPPAAPAT